MYLTAAGILVFGVAAYGLGRVYPPLGPSQGTVAPAERYVSSQVGDAADVMPTDEHALPIESTLQLGVAGGRAKRAVPA